jgi:nitrous oxide reductase accessory protein NosL
MPKDSLPANPESTPKAEKPTNQTAVQSNASSNVFTESKQQEEEKPQTTWEITKQAFGVTAIENLINYFKTPEKPKDQATVQSNASSNVFTESKQQQKAKPQTAWDVMKGPLGVTAVEDLINYFKTPEKPKDQATVQSNASSNVFTESKQQQKAKPQTAWDVMKEPLGVTAVEDMVNYVKSRKKTANQNVSEAYTSLNMFAQNNQNNENDQQDYQLLEEKKPTI